MSVGLSLENAWWLLALPPALGALLWAWRVHKVRLSPQRTRLVQALRIAALCALVLALAGLTGWRRTDRLTVVFAVDRSRSLDAAAREEADGFLREAAETLPARDRAGVLAFGGESMVETAPAEEWRAGEILARPSPEATDLESAVRLATGLFPPGHEKRLVLLTDGIETRGSVEDALLGLSDPPDLVWVPLRRSEEAAEVLVEQVSAPEVVQEGEPHRVRVVLRASEKTEALLRVYRGAVPVAASEVTLEPGRPNVFSFLQESPPGAGVSLYRARVESVRDATPENNRASALTRIRGRPRVLLLDEDPSALAPLEAALAGADMRVERGGPDALPVGPLGLADWDAIVLSDVPATWFSDEQLEALRTWVEAFGGGLVMTGGPGSFGPGGYWQTPVEEVLPVRMEVKDRSFYPSLGLVLAIDKSGSMAGMTATAKIEVAKSAAAEVAKNMLPMDRLGVVAFDAAAKWVVPLTSGAESRRIIHQIGTLAAGGGTDPYPALELALETLAEADVRVKHVLVLTDGQIPARDYGGLLERIAEARITVSTVAIGTDADTRILEWIAKQGDGRFYLARDIDRLPRIFLREAFHVARAWISEESFHPVRRDGHPALVGLPLDSTPPLLGYVGTAEKAAARHPLGTPRGDPLLSLWRTGLGKSVAFTSDPKARWGAPWLGWEGYAPFWSRLLRWSLKDETPERLRATADVRDGRLHVAADVMGPEGAFVNGAAVRALVVGPEGDRREVPLRQSGPGRYEAVLDTDVPGPYLAAVLREDAPGGTQGATAATVLPYSDEFRSLGRSAAGLERLVDRGRARIARTPDGIFEHLEEGGRVRWSLVPWLLALTACLLVAEVAARKLRSPFAVLAERREAREAAAAARPEVLAGLRRARTRADRRLRPSAPPAASSREDDEEPAPPAAKPPEPAEAKPSPAAEQRSREPDEEEPGEQDTTSRLLSAKRRRRED